MRCNAVDRTFYDAINVINRQNECNKNWGFCEVKMT